MSDFTLEDLPADMDCVQSHFYAAQPGQTLTEGLIVDCRCVRLRGGRAQMWTPCCGRIRRNLADGQEASCPACKRVWRLHILGVTNRLVLVKAV